MIHLVIFLLILIATIALGITLILEYWNKDKLLILILITAIGTWIVAEAIWWIGVLLIAPYMH